MSGKIGIAACVFLLCACIGETSGQEILNFTEPRKLPSKINSAAEESLPLPTKDGLFFVRSFYEENTGGASAGQDIWFSRRVNNEWQTPHNNFPLFNNKDNNAVIGVNRFENTVYFFNSYHRDSKKIIHINFSIFEGDAWSMPRTLIIKGIEPGGRFSGFYMHPSEDVFLISMEGKNSKGAEDLYASLRDSWGRWSKPIHLGDEINTAGFEIAPFLTADKKRIYFSSSGRPDSQNADIYYSERLDNSWRRWTEPTRLPDGVNSPFFDAYFSIHENEAFFVSNRDADFTDIYVAEIVEEQPVAKQQKPDEAEKTGVRAAAAQPQDSFNLLRSKGSAYIYFDLASHRLSPDMERMLTYIAENLSGQTYQLELIGFADDLGSAEFNKELSRRRAESVKTFLVDRGLRAERIFTLGKGELELKEEGPADELRRKNRRVELVIVE